MCPFLLLGPLGTRLLMRLSLNSVCFPLFVPPYSGENHSDFRSFSRENLAHNRSLHVASCPSHQWPMCC